MRLLTSEPGQLGRRRVRSLQEAKERYAFMNGVVGVGTGEGGIVVVMVEREDSELRKLVDQEMHELPHRITVVGRVKALRR